MKPKIFGASEVTTLWRYTNMIIVLFVVYVLCYHFWRIKDYQNFKNRSPSVTVK